MYVSSGLRTHYEICVQGMKLASDIVPVWANILLVMNSGMNSIPFVEELKITSVDFSRKMKLRERERLFQVMKMRIIIQTNLCRMRKKISLRHFLVCKMFSFRPKFCKCEWNPPYLNYF